MRVICIKWGKKYSSEYVIKLKNSVERWLSVPHEFVCITESPVDGVNCIQFETKHEGWWAKIELFRPGRFPGANLYLDLDVIVTASLDGFIKPEGRLLALDDFSYSLRNKKQGIDPKTRELLGGDGTCNSSVMFWHDDEARDVWDRFSPEVMTRLHGDQNHITQCLWPNKLALYQPGLACSYKYHVLNNDGHGSVCVFHGNPKPHELDKTNSLRKIWDDYSL